MSSKFVVLTFMLLGMGVSTPAEAHQVKNDGNMAVLLHTDPNDDPYSGTTTVLYFAFTDKKEQFLMENCDCKVYIAPFDQRNEIEERGFIVDLNSADIRRVYGSFSFKYVFPHRDVYAIVVEGSPREGSSFEPFRIEYALRIAKGENLVTSLPTSYFGTDFSPSLALTTLLIIFLIVVGILIQRHFFKK